MNLYKNTSRLLTLIALLIAGCGYHIRGYHFSLPQQLHTLYLHTESPYNKFNRGLIQTLHASNIKLVDQPRQAPYALYVGIPSLTHNTPIGDSSQARIYTFKYSINFKLTDKKNKVIFSKILSSNQTVIVQSGQILGSNNQVSIAEDQLQRSITTKLMYLLSSPEIRQKLAHKR